jgi:8-oxo-dGTP pyrophosphatase MutT (NUDIX family)
MTSLRDAIINRFRAAPAPGRRSSPGTTPETTQDPPPRRGDQDLNPDMTPRLPLQAAAVLVPLMERAEGTTVLLTLRAEHLSDHAGQVSFPGGRIDPIDADAEAAALREAEEEIGLSRAHVQLIGRLDTYVTRTGYEVIPCVGLVTPPLELHPDPSEVAAVFEVPLSFFRDPQNRRRETRIFQGRERHFYVYPWEDRYIWGATAGMLSNLAEVLGERDE